MGQLHRVAGEGDGHVGGQLERGGGRRGQHEGVNTSWGPSKVKAPSTPSSSSRRASSAAFSSPDSRVSIFGRAIAVHADTTGADPPAASARGATAGYVTAVAAAVTVTHWGRWHPVPSRRPRPPSSSGPATPIGFGLGPANPDAFLTALGERDDWEDLTLGGALLLGYYTVLTHPKVSYRCGFFGPAERILVGPGRPHRAGPGRVPPVRPHPPAVRPEGHDRPGRPARRPTGWSTSRCTSAPPTTS